MKQFLTWKNIVILLLVVAAGVGIYFLVRKTPLPEGLIQVNGRIEGDTVVISSKYNGKITRLLAREGDTVRHGEMVVRLDDPETRARLQQARTNLGTMIAQAKAAGQNVGLTAETGGSSIDQARGQVSQAQSSIRDAESEAASAASAINTASAAVRSASATLRQSKESIRRYTAELATARSNLQSVQKTVDAAQSQAKLSATNARRYTNLAKEGVVTERVRDEYVTAAEKDQANLQSAVANAESAKAQVDSRQSDLQHAKDQVAASQADMERSQAQLMSARDQASAANARILTAKGKKVQAEGVLREARTTPTQVAISKSKQTQSLSQIDEARAKVAEEMSTLANLFVVSPINGVVTTRIRDTGEVVTAGSPILEAVDLDRLYLKAYVPEKSDW